MKGQSDNRDYFLHQKQSGFTLIEVMITLAVFSIGILATGAMQYTAGAKENSARDYTLASTIASDQIEALLLVNYNDPTLNPSNTAYDLGAMGPGGKFQLEYWVDPPVNRTKEVTIKVTWKGADRTIRQEVPNSVVIRFIKAPIQNVT